MYTKRQWYSYCNIKMFKGDVNGDAGADFKDIVKINQFRLNKITEL